MELIQEVESGLEEEDDGDENVSEQNDLIDQMENLAIKSKITEQKKTKKNQGMETESKKKEAANQTKRIQKKNAKRHLRSKRIIKFWAANQWREREQDIIIKLYIYTKCIVLFFSKLLWILF